MPKSNAVWGIDIGQCALKALRCERHEADPSVIVADQFDYIEYPKILSQPEADPATLVREALELFLSRNSVRGDRVAISVSGQSGLARFIKLPPVESSKIPDIVKYEARQQIPFSLDDVIWDYQQMAGGSENDGFALETEVGLFAMKRDQVFRALRPLDEAGIEVDYIQLAPLAIYNALVFDQLNDLPPPEEYDPENPPKSVVLISLGTDNTDLVITNGYRVWQRNLPLGGNHFTRALTKELKLTFSAAEHLKRNATAAEDPKAVFQAMRPVFNDLLNEVQKSIGFFTGIDKTAQIGRVVALGNAMKLPGLQRFLAQNLGYDVSPVESFRGLAGPSVVAAPAFAENLLSYGVCYGLCLQGLGQGNLRTNLLPKELITERVIREKKPIAVVAVAGLLVGLSINYFAHWSAWHSSHPDRYSVVPAETLAADAKGTSARLKQEYETRRAEYDTVDKVGQNLVSNVEGRMLWLEVLKAIDAALPPNYDAGGKEAISIDKRKELHITEIDCERFADLSTWFAPLAQRYREGKIASETGVELEEAAADGAAAPAADPAAAPAPAPAAATPAPPAGAAPAGAAPGTPSEDTGPKGPGWVIQVKGYHYYYENPAERGATFVRRRFMKNLEEGVVLLPVSPGSKETVKVPIKDLGIGYPVLVQISRINKVSLALPQSDPAAGGNGAGNNNNASEDDSEAEGRSVEVRKFDFTLQFSWIETPPSARIDAAKRRDTEMRSVGPPGSAPPGQGMPRASVSTAGPTAIAGRTGGN